MNGQKFDVNSLRIASPCSVGWETMSGDERTRHCHLCSLNVYNVSALTPAEVENLILKREGRVCIRMYRRADGTVLTKDCPVGFRAIQKRAARLAGASLAAILGLFSISLAQKDDKKAIDASKVKITRTVSITEDSELTGTVVDANGAVIPGAKIMLSTDKRELTTTSKDDGTYSFLRITSGTYSIRIELSGFKIYQLKNLIIKGNEYVQLNIELTIGEGTMGLVGIVSDSPPIDTTSSTIQTVITPRQIKNLPINY